MRRHDPTTPRCCRTSDHLPPVPALTAPLEAPRRYSLALTWLGFLLLAPNPVAAQWAWLPGGPLPRLRVPPREPHLGVRLIGVENGASAFGRGVEWEANFGHMIPLVRLRGDRPDRAVTLGVQAGVFGRFAFETKKRDQISSDWVFAAPLFITDGEHWYRIRYRHISSHLGDDYIARFGDQPEGYLRDDIGVLVYRQLTPAIAVYGGPNVAFNVDPNRNKRLAASAGLEINTRRLHETRWYTGIDVHLDQDASWEPRVNIHAGTYIWSGPEERLRLTIEVLTGPSPQGQFRRSKASYIALGLVVEL